MTAPNVIDLVPQLRDSLAWERVRREASSAIAAHIGSLRRALAAAEKRGDADDVRLFAAELGEYERAAELIRTQWPALRPPGAR